MRTPERSEKENEIQNSDPYTEKCYGMDCASPDCVSYLATYREVRQMTKECPFCWNEITGTASLIYNHLERCENRMRERAFTVLEETEIMLNHEWLRNAENRLDPEMRDIMRAIDNE